MKSFVLNEISIHRHIRGGAFPFELGRQTRAAPIREGVRFEITDVRDRLGFVDRTKTGEREIPPRAVAFVPIKRRLPALFVHRRPAERKPKLRARVTAGFDEFEIFAVRDRTRSQ